jgi:hypothetical protein
MAVGISAPMLSVYAAGHQSSVDVWNPPKGFDVIGAKEPHVLEINIGDTVSWNIMEGQHSITPRDAKQWGDGGSADSIDQNSPRYTAKNFKTAGDYQYYCKVHDGMTGIIRVNDPNATPPATDPPTTQTTSTPPTQSTQPPATTPSSAPATTPVTTATVPATGRPAPAPTAPAPTTTTAKPEKDKKPKDETTTTSSTLPPPVDIPDSAIIPALPGSTGTSSADPGTPGEAPNSAPEGEAIALLKAKKNDGNAVKLLILSGIGLGALGVGTAGYKYANRSSKYFPA